MTHDADVLDRLAQLSGAPSRGYEELLRRRAKRQLARKIGAIAVVSALVVALLGIGLGTIGDRAKRPANPPDESRARTFTGMVIRYTSPVDEQPGDLVAQDPVTGKVRTVVDSGSLPGDVIYSAAVSGDGRWVAFNVATQCADGDAALWVSNGVDEPRQLTDPCAESPDVVDYGRWAWSPTGSQLAVIEGDRLVLIDPGTGGRTDLGRTATDDAGLPTWSPDGNQIAYEAVPNGSPNGNSTHDSVYVVSVDGGDHTLIAESLGQIPVGEEGAGIAWSPDGTRIAVLAAGPGAPPWNATLYVMNADGSERLTLAQDVLTQHVLGSPNIDWSPDGTKIAYATIPDDAYALPAGQRDRFPFRIWSVAPDGSDRVLVFDALERANGMPGGPVWSPDGARIAFRFERRAPDKTWLVANADGGSDAHEIDQMQPLSWRGGWYFCECYG